MEQFVYSVLDSLRPGWRARRFQTRWKYLTHLLWFSAWLPMWYGCFRLMWEVHLRFHPEHAGRLSEYWGEGISLWAFVPSFLLLMPLAAPSLLVAALVANAVIWCIPPARRAFRREAEACPAKAYGRIMRELLHWTPRVAGIAFSLSVLGAVLLRSLR